MCDFGADKGWPKPWNEKQTCWRLFGVFTASGHIRINRGQVLIFRKKCDFFKYCSVSPLFLDCSTIEWLCVEFKAITREKERERGKGRSRQINKLTTCWDATPGHHLLCISVGSSEAVKVQSLGGGTVTQNLEKKHMETHTQRTDASIFRRALVECCKSVRRTRGLMENAAFLPPL